MNDLIVLIGAIGGVGTSIFTLVILFKWLYKEIKPITVRKSGKVRNEK